MTCEEFYGHAYGTMQQAEKQLLEQLRKYASEAESKDGMEPIIHTCSQIKALRF